MLDWASSYSKKNAISDLLAAVVVTVMLIPQSLAYAMLAGLPPQVGLYASILPLIAYAIFGTSRTLAVGPVAVVSLMTAVAAGQVATQGTPEYLAATITLALLSGIILLVMSVLRLGFLANFLSHPVISGFITASGILIAASQLKHILGIKVEGHTLPEILQQLAQNAALTNTFTLAIGVSSIALMVWVRKNLKPLLLTAGFKPGVADFVSKGGPVAAIALSTVAVMALQLEGRGVMVVGFIPQDMPPFALPVFEFQPWRDLLPAALLISMVGFVESVSVGQTLAARRRQRIVPNQELLALGASNVASALSGGFPVTGGFSRSVVNYDAGAATPLAGAYTAAGILLATLFLTPVFRFLPHAVLAATIIVAVLSLVDFAAIKRIFSYSKTDFAAMAATIMIVLLVGIETGIIAGVTLSLLLFLWRTSRPHMAIVGQVAGTEQFRNVLRHPVITDPEILSIRIDESLYFANSRFLEDVIYDQVAARRALKHVVLMCPAVNLIDVSALESLEAIAHRLNTASVGFHLSEVKGPVMDALRRSDFFEHFKGQVFLSQFEAIQALSSPLAPAT